MGALVDANGINDIKFGLLIIDNFEENWSVSQDICQMLSENIVSTSLITLSIGLTRSYIDEFGIEWEERCNKCLERAKTTVKNKIYWENLRDIDDMKNENDYEV